MSDIPLKIRVGIRDQWESPRAPIRNIIDSLTKTLGYTITPQVDWPTLYDSLKETFTEASTFVPAICRITIAFYGRLLSRLEYDNNNEWIEKFLEEMAKVMEWKLVMEVDEEGVFQRPHLTWKVATGIFCIRLPKQKPAGNVIIEAGFDEDLDGFLGNAPPIPPKSSSSPALPISPISSASPTPSDFPTPPDLPISPILTLLTTPSILPTPSVPPVPSVSPITFTVQLVEEPKTEPQSTEHDWAEKPDSTSKPWEQSQEEPSPFLVPFSQPSRPKSVIESVQVVDILAVSDEPLEPVAPYFLIVNAEKIPFRIQCNHQSSLESVATYLKKWARPDQNSTTKQPLLKIEMIESAFFSNVIDAISIEPSYSRGDPEPLNPTIILGFVEGVLGYKETFTNGTRWVFKREPKRNSGTSSTESDPKAL